MTHRLYYYDATLRTFAANVVARDQLRDENGVLRPAVCLDQTVFYPTSGGQPHDTGLLSDIRVVDVVEDASGEIWHLLEEELPADMTEVDGEIDWARRFDHMQQHSGQHLLSAVFEDAGPDVTGRRGHTIGFHLGTDASTIDLDLPDLTWEEAFAVEATVNNLIWQNRQVGVHIVSPDEAASRALRKPLAEHIAARATDEARVVSITGIDASACGGTHVRATGEVGLLKITGIAHYKGGIRVDFLCGGRALAAYQRTLQALQAGGAMLSVGLDEVPEAVGRVQEEAQACRRELRRVLGELLDYETERLWRGAVPIDGKHIIVSHWSSRDFDEVRTLAAQLRAHPATVALLAATAPDPSGKGGVRVVCARSDDLPEVDARAILRDALMPIGGRGGGQPALAQGGAPFHPADDVVAALESAVAQLL
ncbi:MAG: hypothetical protein JXC32_09580 [Anaerolineae bacterium]|nr:hypothetical protein [Anaerolineae bacterium]